MLNKLVTNKNKIYFCIRALGLIFLFFSQSVFAEGAFEKSLQELKKAIQGQAHLFPNPADNTVNTTALTNNSDINEVFGAEVPIEPPPRVYLWQNKDAFFEAVSNGEMANYNNSDSKFSNSVIESIEHILAYDYNTPYKVPQNSACIPYFFNSRVDAIVKLITKSKLEKLSKTPPEFIGNNESNIQANNNQGRLLLNDLSNLCSENSSGRKSPYPFVSSLSLLLKEYSNLTEAYVEKIRIEKVEAYKVAQENNRVALLEKGLAESQAKIKENEINEKNLREKKFQDEFNQKEKARIAECFASTVYIRFNSASVVQENLSRVDYAKGLIKKEKEIGATSGYDDATKLHELGRMQVFAQDNVNEAYKNYRKNGGSANTPANVVAGKNPCL